MPAIIPIKGGCPLFPIFPNGSSVATEYDVEGRDVAITDPGGWRTETAYDAIGQPRELDLGNGSFFQMEFDAIGRDKTVVNPVGSSLTFENNDQENSETTIDSLDAKTKIIHDVMGRQDTLILDDGQTYHYQYDAMGRQTKQVLPDSSTLGVEYDALGRKVAEIDQEGRRKEYIYNEAGNLIGVKDAAGAETRYSYDGEGNLASLTDPNGHVTTFEYDALGRMTRRTLSLGQTETWEYRDDERKAFHADFNGAVTEYHFDAMKKEILRIYPDGGRVERTYNPRGLPLTIASSQGVERFEYDYRGYLIKNIKPDGNSIEYDYDAFGRLLRTRAGGGYDVAYAYDQLNRLVSVQDGQGETSYAYNNLGLLTEMNYPNGINTAYRYDSHSRLTDIVATGPQGVISSYRLAVSPSGNVTQVVENNGDRTNYEYDRADRIIKEIRAGQIAYALEYKYDPFGNRLEMNHNGDLTSYVYDDNDRLITENSPQGTSNLAYDDNGNLVQKFSPSGVWDYNWTYNNLLARADFNGNLVASYEYDLYRNRVSKTTDAGTVKFLIDNRNPTGYSQVLKELDANNNKIASYTFGLDLISQHLPDTSYYHYDRFGSTRKLSSPSGSATEEYLYGALGQMIFQSENASSNHGYLGEFHDSDLNLSYLRSRYLDDNGGRFVSMDPIMARPGVMPVPNNYGYANSNPSKFTDLSGNQTLLDDIYSRLIQALIMIKVVGAVMSVKHLINMQLRPRDFSNPTYSNALLYYENYQIAIMRASAGLVRSWATTKPQGNNLPKAVQISKEWSLWFGLSISPQFPPMDWLLFLTANFTSTEMEIVGDKKNWDLRRLGGWTSIVGLDYANPFFGVSIYNLAMGDYVSVGPLGLNISGQKGHDLSFSMLSGYTMVTKAKGNWVRTSGDEYPSRDWIRSKLGD